MKSSFKISILTLFLFFFSCSDNDAPTLSEKENLVGVWKIFKVKTFTYIDGKLDKVEEKSFEESDQSKLIFTNKGKVSYSSKEFKTQINGIWELNNRILRTNLSIDLSPATGYGTIYLFPENEVILLSQNLLTLKYTTSIEHMLMPSGEKYKYCTETYLKK